MSRLLKGCVVEELTEAQARRVGLLVAQSGLAGTIDLAVVDGAVRRDDAVVTSNRAHIEQGAAATGDHLAIHDV